MASIIFDPCAEIDDKISKEVQAFLNEMATLEASQGLPVIVHQDGKSKSYYVKCSFMAEVVYPFIDTDAKLNPSDKDSFRANRELLTKHYTYKRMLSDAEKGREFSDIIVEYNKSYSPDKPLKVWGGQHRIKAITEAYSRTGLSRCHGFRIYFNLSKQQRTEIALISNTNIAVSNDLFDRLLEETEVGLNLRQWCIQVGLLNQGQDFPDQGSRAECITIKLARTFVTDFYKGKSKAEQLGAQNNFEDDISEYEPYLCISGASLDPEYEYIVNQLGNYIWNDPNLQKAGESFAALHKAQYDAVRAGSGIEDSKAFRTKALTETVISAWAYVAGLLQCSPEKLNYHYQIPKPTKTIPDPLNAKAMSNFKHEYDDPTYRGLGTRSNKNERLRMALLFLEKSLENGTIFDKDIMDRAVSRIFMMNLKKRYKAK